MVFGAAIGSLSAAAPSWALETDDIKVSDAALQSADVQSTDSVETTPITTNMNGDLSQRTDTELTALTAQWANLSPMERRHLLAEVRGRMAKGRLAKTRTIRRPIGIRVQRQYGRVVRKSDGSVVLQTRVVQVQPRVRVTETGSRQTITFGFGFERRSRSVTQQAPATETPEQPEVNQLPPTMTVNQQQVQTLLP